ncbi:MAG: hypothetical protein ACI8RZ_004083 [Myxococcota bacterium]|jgi:hypothetical protein
MECSPLERSAISKPKAGVGAEWPEKARCNDGEPQLVLEMSTRRHPIATKLRSPKGEQNRSGNINAEKSPITGASRQPLPTASPCPPSLTNSHWRDCWSEPLVVSSPCWCPQRSFRASALDAQRDERRCVSPRGLQAREARRRGESRRWPGWLTPHSDGSPVAVFDVAYTHCGAFGSAASRRWDDGGCSLTHALRFAIVDAMLFLATPLQRWPLARLCRCAQGGLHSLRECPPCGRSPWTTRPADPSMTPATTPHVGSLSDPSCITQSAGWLQERLHSHPQHHPPPQSSCQKSSLHRIRLP